MMENVERYNQVKVAINQLLGSKDIVNALGAYNNEIRETIAMVCRQLDRLASGQVVKATNGEKERVFKNALRILTITNTVRLTPRFKNFVRLWIELTENWNMQIGYSEDLHIVNNTLGILIDLTSTVEDLIKSARLIMRELNAVRQISPGGIKVSELFYKTILEKQNCGEPISEYEKS